MTHLTAVSYSLLAYLFLGLMYYGWGRAAAVLLGVGGHKPDSPAVTVWLGWAGTLLLFQILHFFLPVNAFVTVPVLALGSVWAIPSIQKGLRGTAVRRADRVVAAFFGVLALGTAAWVASRAMLPPGNYDSGLYHFNAIRWINTYPVVPGLGNLHGRLAFNQSFFTYAAALNFFPFFGHGRSLANSFLFLLTMATLLPALEPVIRKPSRLLTAHPFAYVPVLFLLPLGAYHALSSTGLSAPTPDMASVLLQMTMFFLLARGIAAWKTGIRPGERETVVLVVLAATAVTVKLSNLAFSLAAFGFAAAYTRHVSLAFWKDFSRLVLSAAVIVLVWAVHGVALSGAPLYPSTIGRLQVDWAVPAETAVDMARWIYSWSRIPGAHWQDVLGGWTWVRPWFGRMLAENKTDAVYPALVAVVFWAMSLAGCCFRKGTRSRSVEWAMVTALFLCMGYWFLTAPDPRLANAVIFLTAISSILLFLATVRDVLGRRMYFVALCAAFLAGNGNILHHVFRHGGALRQVSTSGWHAVPAVPLEKRITASGLGVYTPQTGNQCWDSPLPSSPTVNDRLRLRVPGRMSSGFTVRGEVYRRSGRAGQPQ